MVIVQVLRTLEFCHHFLGEPRLPNLTRARQNNHFAFKIASDGLSEVALHAWLLIKTLRKSQHYCAKPCVFAGFKEPTSAISSRLESLSPKPYK
jgi:hypothetical protein